MLAVKYASLILIPASIAVMVFSQDLVHLTYGRGYALAPQYLTIVSAVYLLTGLGLNVIGSFLNGVAKPLNRPQDKRSDACGLPSTRSSFNMALGTLRASHRILTLLHCINVVQCSQSLCEFRRTSRPRSECKNFSCFSSRSCPFRSISSTL